MPHEVSHLAALSNSVNLSQAGRRWFVTVLAAAGSGLIMPVKDISAFFTCFPFWGPCSLHQEDLFLLLGHPTHTYLRHKAVWVCVTPFPGRPGELLAFAVQQPDNLWGNIRHSCSSKPLCYFPTRALPHSLATFLCSFCLPPWTWSPSSFNSSPLLISSLRPNAS